MEMARVWGARAREERESHMWDWYVAVVFLFTPATGKAGCDYYAAASLSHSSEPPRGMGASRGRLPTDGLEECQRRGEACVRVAATVAANVPLLRQSSEKKVVVHKSRRQKFTSVIATTEPLSSTRRVGWARGC